MAIKVRTRKPRSKTGAFSLNVKGEAGKNGILDLRKQLPSVKPKFWNDALSWNDAEFWNDNEPI